MQLFVVIIFLSISIVQTVDYDINNQQICTQTPFMANFGHNCSRTRLTKDVTTPNTDQVLYITIMFKLLSNIDTLLTITKSVNYNQTVYLAFFTILGRYVYVNNKTSIPLNDTTISLYVYDTLSEQITQMNSPSVIPLQFLLSDPFCYLRNTSLPAPNVSRVYYLYTNETNLNIDLSTSSYRISPRFNDFDVCFTVETSLTTLGIVLIVLVSVFSLVSVILLAFCLRRQIKEMYLIVQNWIRQRAGLTPKTIH